MKRLSITCKADAISLTIAAHISCQQSTHHLAQTTHTEQGQWGRAPCHCHWHFHFPCHFHFHLAATYMVYLPPRRHICRIILPKSAGLCAFLGLRAAKTTRNQFQEIVCLPLPHREIQDRKKYWELSWSPENLCSLPDSYRNHNWLHLARFTWWPPMELREEASRTSLLMVDQHGMRCEWVSFFSLFFPVDCSL